jgi:hypothetical protein
MAQSSDNNVHPFYIYNLRKTHGYIYSDDDTLYHSAHRYNIKHYLPPNIKSPLIIEDDLRPKMDDAQNKIPIDSNQILQPSNQTIRTRTSNDFFTYTLQPPIYNSRVGEFMKKMIPDPKHYHLFQMHLFLSLIMYRPRSYVVIYGSDPAIHKLFTLLTKLSPLIQICNPALYCESTAKKRLLDEIYQSRIVLCDIGGRTIRPASYPSGKKYEHPIQFHGIVRQIQNPATVIHGQSSLTIKIADIPDEDTFTQGEILGCISWNPV